MFGAESITDEMVLAAAVEGGDARDHVIAALAPQLRAMVLMRLAPNSPQRALVDDLTQQITADLVANLAVLRIKTVNGLRSYVSTLVRRCVAECIRQAGRPRSPFERSLDSSVHDLSKSSPLWSLVAISQSSPQSRAARAEATRLMMQEFSALRPLYREVITLAFYDQISMNGLSAHFDISLRAATMLLWRAVRTLRRRMTGSSRLESRPM